MTKTEKIRYVKRMLVNYEGDDLERATHAFSGLGPEELNNEYGQSGQTCAEILKRYTTNRANHTEVAQWLEELMK